ncbi:MAG: deoxyribodipyrimidine photo-lyase, partial [Pseudomonadota bacterium]
MTEECIIHWFRQDLRLSDNPSLSEAARQGQVLPVYILDDQNAEDHQMGAASHWWLHHSLCALNDSLDGHLAVFKGDALTILDRLIKNHPVKAVYWNRCYEPWKIELHKQVKQTIDSQGITAKSFNGTLLWEPWA